MVGLRTFNIRYRSFLVERRTNIPRRYCYPDPMDKMLTYVLENFKQLTPFHLLLVVLLTILASAGMFFVFRWLFASRLDAQRDLLQMKSEQVTELKVRFSELKSEGVQLSQELAQ